MARRSPQDGRRSAGPPRPGTVGPGEFVAYPGGPTAVYDLLERLAAAAGDSPDAGTHGISLDRRRLTVRWSGPLPAAVQRVVDSAGEEVTVVVQQTAHRAGDLRAEAARLAREHPGVVAAAVARPEGDGIEVLVPPVVADAAGGAEQALAGIASPFPLFAEIGEA
jgi:hypothetical protein